MGEITKIKIFPSIGIMRVGNSPDQFFIGPEVPGHFEVPEGGFKDAQCRIKRQAARFRLYGYDDAGSKPVEITAQDAVITWKVTLANKKASGKCIFPQWDEKVWRNEWYTGDRGDLNIRPSPRSLTGANQGPLKFDDGKFLKKENGSYVQTETVVLGEMRTDELGRLLVLGGLGKSGGVELPADVPGYPIFTRTFNTPGWYDDIADGPVTAEVTLKNGKVITDILPAWVISAPPSFAPQISHLTTLYDALRQTAINHAALGKLPAELVEGLKAPAFPSFKRDVLPILQRALELYWLSNLVKWGNSDPQSSPHFESFKTAEMDPAERKKLFNYLKPPGNPQKGSMPKLWGDNYSNMPTETVLTPTQYSIMENWAKDAWSDPNIPPPIPFENPEDLTQAALEGCVGGALYPGIEASRFLRDKCEFIEPFRLKHGFTKEDGTPLEAGDITIDMALPWHGDFAHCRQEGTADPHAWWPAQHPDHVFPDIDSTAALDWVRGIIDNTSYTQDRLDMVARWHQLGFVVRKGDRFIETERYKVCNDLFLILDRTHFSSKEVPNTFENCFYVVIEGFKPSELGIVKEDLTEEELLNGIAPAVTLKHEGKSDGTSGMTALPQELLLEITPFEKDKPQRLTFVYKIKFTNDMDFIAAGKERITLTAKKKHPTEEHVFSAVGELTLFKQPNPYMQDGKTAWLSTDVRVFKVLEDEGALGFKFNKLEEDSAEAAAQAASNFIKAVVFEFNKDHTKLEGHPFEEELKTEQADSQLELAEKPGGRRAFNFAIARVRYRGNAPALNVRVFFRLFTTAVTGLDYRVDTTYRHREGDDPIALLGYQAGNIASIPCYANPRTDSEDQQTDGLNVKTLDAGVGDDERYYYFGCWLDFNQTTPRLPDPLNPGQKKSIQDQIRGLHQCLVAEVYFEGDEIPEGATPASSENLSQRNLMYVESPNPGEPWTRTVQHTFEIKAATQAPAFAAAVVADSREWRPDELMIRWNDLPRDSQVTLYMPGVASEVLGMAERNYDAGRLEQSEAHALRCLPGDVTYVPLPAARKENIPALLSIELPEGIKRGDEFNIVVHQISGRPRRILGAFQLNINVSTRAALLRPEIHNLSVLRYIFRSIPVDDRWHPVFARYLDQIAERVRGFGGDPDAVLASPDGSGTSEAVAQNALLSWLVAMALALFIVVAGVHPLANYLPEIIAAILLFAALLWWAIKSSPSICRIIITFLIGLGIGAALLATFLLAGLASRGLLVLALAALIFGALIVAGLLSGCLGLTEKNQA